MINPAPEAVNAIAIEQTLMSFAKSLDDCQEGSPEATIRLAFEAVASLLRGSVDANATKLLTTEQGLAVLNVMSAGMDRMLELSAMQKVEVPFGR